MRRMQLDEVEAGAHGPAGRLGKERDYALDARLIQLLRHLPAFVEGKRRSGNDRPGIFVGAERIAAFQGRLCAALRPACAS